MDTCAGSVCEHNSDALRCVYVQILGSDCGARSSCDGGVISLCDSVMAPKKKQRTSGGNEVPAVQASLDKWLQTLYELRHAEEDKSKPAVHPWPVLHGGTFLDVACRGWKDLQSLTTSVHKLVVRAELMDADSSETEFLSKYCKMEAGCCRVSGLSIFLFNLFSLFCSF